jgi:hypothetical protein
MDWEVGQKVQYRNVYSSYGIVVKVNKDSISVQWLDGEYKTIPPSIYYLDDIGGAVTILTPVIAELYDFK